MIGEYHSGSKRNLLIDDNVLDRDAYIYEKLGGDETLATNYMIPDTVRECLYSEDNSMAEWDFDPMTQR